MEEIGRKLFLSLELNAPKETRILIQGANKSLVGSLGEDQAKMVGVGVGSEGKGRAVPQISWALGPVRH